MKPNIILLLMLSLTLLLCGCAGNQQANPPTPTEPPGGDPLDITAFSFQHSASLADDCYLFNVTQTTSGTYLYAEEQFSGGRVADVMIDESVLEQLEEVTGNCRVDLWDGFDQNNSKVRDGSSFTLDITLADGSTIHAHGNNAFPDYYHDVLAVVQSLYSNLMEQYGLSVANSAAPISG